jgi:hypothetical protein
MKKHIKTELQLNQKQLQEITGGCAQCVTDISQAGRHQTFANSYTNLSQTATTYGKANEAKRYLNLARGHFQAARTLLQKVADRGHS